jgi:uncharacterized protein YjbJ (UPF0337 family)
MGSDRDERSEQGTEATAMSDHTSEDLKGRLKEAVGDLTGDKALQREGKIDQGSAEIKKQLDKATDKMKEVVNPRS